MSELKFKTLNGDEKTIDSNRLEAFHKDFRGRLIPKDDKDYEETRKIWNGMIDLSPALIARCSGGADVIAAVKFAREHNLLVSVRGGGHSVAGLSLSDGGLLIDLSAMKGVHIDPVKRIARAQAGLTLGDLDHESQAFGLAVPAGIVTTTGVAGLTLGGGFGWLTRKYGLTCDNLLSIDVVTADGKFITASDQENADLFWGIRGGGGNFGIVTSFEFRLQPVGPTVLAGAIFHPLSAGPKLIPFYRDFIKEAPRELTTIAALRRAPPAPFLPQEIHGKPIAAVFVCYAGDVKKGEEVLKPLRQFGSPVGDNIGPKPFKVHQAMLDPMQPKGRKYYWKANDLPGLSNGAIDTLITHAEAITSPHTIMAMFQLGGAAADIPEDATAYSHRSAAFALNCNAGWDDADNDKHIQWARNVSDAIQPHASGVYVNFLGNEGDQRARAAYGEGKYQKLVALKTKYDPANFFRLNQNIKPAAH
jgi:FAD/FMN-containing dehydrogenase